LALAFKPVNNHAVMVNHHPAKTNKKRIYSLIPGPGRMFNTSIPGHSLWPSIEECLSYQKVVILFIGQASIATTFFKKRSIEITHTNNSENS
jgi:hypothetical protein